MGNPWTACRIPLLVPAILLAGCMSGNVLGVKGGLARPEKTVPGPGVSGRTVAVLDFSYAPAAAGGAGEIGRDYDHVRAIVWDGAPGKAVPDLIALVLVEKGVPVVRVGTEAEVPPDIEGRVWGRVDDFRVDSRRKGTVNVEDAARVAVTLMASGPGVPSGWSSQVASEYWVTDAVFVSSQGVREAINGAANAAAEEAFRRLVNAGLVPAPREAPAAPAGTDAR